MSSDEIVWQVINQQFCSFKLKYVICPQYKIPQILTLDLEPQKTRTSAGMNIMSQDSVIGNLALWQTLDMPQSALTQALVIFTST
jgi:hypothetical protein